MRFFLAFLFAQAICQCSLAQPTNTPSRLPPLGIPIPEIVRSVLTENLAGLQASIPKNLPTTPLLHFTGHGFRDFQWPDAQIYEKAVRYALEHNEFYHTNEFLIARRLIHEGLERLQTTPMLRLPGTVPVGPREAPWTRKSGPVVLGYRSKIDGSVQPYGLVIPPTYPPESRRVYRLDVWLHGRDEKLTELKFIHERSTKSGEFTPPDTFVLHPYGRYCNAFKFAGEIDVMEALEDVQRRFPIDPMLITMRGFSMGGAGVWHLATHYADKWVAAAPGAGFAETARYLRLNPETIRPWERALWQWYDATDYAANLFHCPTVAYSGELDKQKQAADVMAEALAKERLPLIHLIGPKTEHKYEPETKKALNSIVDQFAVHIKEEFPEVVHFTTRTLRYPKMYWLQLMGLEKHWERADAIGFLFGSSVGAVDLDAHLIHTPSLQVKSEGSDIG